MAKPSLSRFSFRVDTINAEQCKQQEEGNGSLLTMNNHNHHPPGFDPSQIPQPIRSSNLISSAHHHQQQPNASSEAVPSAAVSSTQSMTMVNTRHSSSPPTISNTSDLIERIINAAETRESSSRESSLATTGTRTTKPIEAVEGGPFTNSELSQLSLVKTESWVELEGGTIVSLCGMLRVHVASGVGIDLVGEGRNVVKMKEGDVPVISVQQWMQQAKYSGPNSAPLGSLGESKLEPGGGYRRLQILYRALEAANILLGIMGCRGIDRRAVEDDAVENCVDLIKKHIIPSLSNTGHLTISAPGTSLNESSGDEQVTADPVSPKKKRRKTTSLSPMRNDVCKNMKTVYTPILSTIGLFGTILERADGFIVTNEMDDRLLFTLSAAALSTLSIDASSFVRSDTTSLASIVQVSSMDVLVSIFRRYPRHRSIIIEDLFPLMLKLPTSKRSLRTFLVKKIGSSKSSEVAKVKPELAASSSVDIGDHELIQPICALVLLFVQACVQMPIQIDEDMEEGGADEDEEEEETGNSKANDSSGLDGCVAVCNQFTAQLLLRCSRKGEEGGASEFRPILHNLVDDLLAIRHQPEFPAAEMLLLHLSSRLGNDLMRASSAPKNAPVEATYLSTAMDAFGKITSAVASALQQYRENPFQILPETLSPSECEPKEEVNRCFCGRGRDAFMIDCDRCHSWYHGSCIGITQDAVPDAWFCDDCTLQSTVLAQAQVFARGSDTSRSLSTFDHSHAMRQLLLHQVTKACESSTSLQSDSVREFIIGTWVKSLTVAQTNPEKCTSSFDLELVKSHVIAQWSREAVQQKQLQRPQLSSDGLDRIMKALVAGSELSINLAKLIGVLLRLMSDDMASLRKLSVKAVLQVVNVDPSLMNNAKVRTEVSRCFNDPSISVREAAVCLVGEYVVSNPNLAPAFHTRLLERILDKGVSVRKRVIKIFRDILLSNPTYQGRAAAMNCMLQRASDRKEDDNVRDLIFETFHTLWFDSSSFNMSVASLAVDSKKTPQAGVKAELYCREAVTQMVEVVKAAGTPDDLTCLVKGLLFGFADDDKDKKVAERKRRQQDARGQCKRLVSSLFEILLHFEDTRTNQESDGKELVAIFSTLGVFSQAYPELLVPHVDTVVPYLKGDNGAKRQEAQVVSNVSNIISRITSNFSQEELSRLTNGGLPTDLVNIAYKFPSDAVNSAVEALCKLSNHPHAKPGSVQEKKLHKLACQFYSYLIKTEDSINGPTTKKSIKDNIRRALSALGGICRYYVCDSNDHHNIDPSTFSDTPPVDQLQFSDNVLSNACFSIFLKYLSKDDEATKCLALRAMTGVFISRPRVVLCAEQMGIINEVMSDDAAASVQIEALKSWRDILLAEEIRIESGAAKAKMASQKNITVSNRISGDQDGDSSISGSVLTKHAPRLYEMTMSKDEKVRYMIVDLIGHLLRQGLINPMETVPYLLAMQGDVKSQSTRSLALKLLINEGEKRPDMLNQRIQAGVKRAFNFQKAVYPQESEENVPSVTALLENNNEGARVSFNTIFDEVIKESSIRNKKAQRQALYKSIIGMFEREAGDSILTKATGSTRDDADRLPLLAFAAQILAHLPYNCTADPLFIVYHASCITALEGNELLVRLAELVGNDVCDPNAGEDELEKCAKLKNPKTSAFASKLIKNDDNFSATEFGALCEKASGLILLLNLKDFLRKAYNLSEARITEYLPSEKDRINEKGISIAEGTPKFSAPVSSIFSGDDDLDWNTAIRTYALFRVLMREGDVDAELHFDEGAKKKGKKRKRTDDPENSPVCPVPQPLSQISPDNE